MVKGCRLPSDSGVAGLTVLREPPRDVIRIRSALEILQMAGSAGRAGQVVVIVDMAVEANARRIGVRIREREAHACMIEFRIQPGIRSMASFASRRKSRRHVIRVGCRLKVVCVARVALRGKPLKLSRRCAFVARFAVNSRVCADQRKPILVIAYRLYRNRPTLDRVTRFAVGAELPAVKIGMAVRTPLAHVGKHQFDVALRAFHFFMRAAQRVARRIVVKFRDAADWPPTQRRMAVFAWNIQGPTVWIPSSWLLCRGTALGAELRSEEKNGES